MNLDNVKYASILIKIKKDKAFEIELRNCEKVTETTLQKLLVPLRRQLREVKAKEVQRRNREIKEQTKRDAPVEDLDAVAMGIS